MTLPFAEDVVAASLTFSPSLPCAGGEHILLSYTLIVDGQTVNRTRLIERSKVKNDPLTADDADELAYLLARVIARQVALGNVRNALLNTDLDLSAVVA